MLAGDQQDRIKELLLRAFSDAGSPAEMAAFIRHESKGRLHCEVKIYLSPMLIAVAKSVDAAPCEKPSPVGLRLLAGTQDSWGILFPEQARQAT